jgi:hypothetical protein
MRSQRLKSAAAMAAHVAIAALAASTATAAPGRIGAVAGGAVAATMKAPAPFIGPHRAAYTLTLQSSQDQGVLGASGTMTYEVTDACTGWTTAQHLVINYTDRDAHDVTMISDYATFETKDGTRLEFHTRQSSGSDVTERLDGTAVLDRSGGKGHADFTSPEHRRVALPPGTFLPTAHTLAILQASVADKRFLAIPLFDGTGAGGAQDTFVTIGARHYPHTERWSALANFPSTRVHVAFFDRNQIGETPNYEVGTRYFDNGVADDLAMNFGDFVMAGKMTQFEAKAIPRC